MLRFLVLLSITSFFNSFIYSEELTLIFKHGKPIKDREAAWEGHIEYADWLDEDQIIYANHANEISCISIKTEKIKWSLPSIGKIVSWSVSRGTKRLALIYKEKEGIFSSIIIIDGNSGKTIFKAEEKQLSEMLGLEYIFPINLLINPKNGNLIIINIKFFYGKNAYLIDSDYKKLLSNFDIDSSIKEISYAKKINRIAIIAEKEVLCITDLSKYKQIYFQGERILIKPESMTGSIDLPFYSHIIDSGEDLFIYSRDNSWATGKIYLHNIKTNMTTSFEGYNGHIEMDASFRSKRIALTGTSEDLTLVNFEGKIISQIKNAAEQRITCVQFSPSSKQILIGSWDNTISVYHIK